MDLRARPGRERGGALVNDDDTPLTCEECGGPIKSWGGSSYTHAGRIQGRNHPAQPARDTAQEASR
jgi:hypothetical protein